MTTTPALDWRRVAEEVRSRRLALGLKQNETEGVSPASWSKLENAGATSYKPFVLANVERLLEWPAGTIMRLARGGDVPGAPVGDDVVDRLTRLEEKFDRIEELLRDALSKPRRAGR